MNQKYLLKVVTLGFVGLTLFSSCANVEQIDRGRLAQRVMQLDPTPHQQAFLSEVRNIREAASGGTGQNAGGGCGCN